MPAVILLELLFVIDHMLPSPEFLGVELKIGQGNGESAFGEVKGEIRGISSLFSFLWNVSD